ncbi:MAG TPA: ABC transporter permease [Thermoanaerobaculia bacterium]|nr:ABC transporter permease [Thermoanaerobaculia bacterium]
MTKALEVFRFELGYQLRRASTRIYFALFLALALLLTWVIFLDARNDGYFFNAPIVTGLMTIVASMFALLVTAGVAGDVATRDAQLRIAPLLYTTPLRKTSYLGGRFLGAFAVNALLLLAVPIGLLLATGVPGIEPELLGPFRVEAYLTAYFLLAVPNAFIATAVLFAIAALTRRAIAAYAGAAVLFFSAFIAEGFVGVRLGRWALAKVLDPLGYTALHALWTTYNPLQKSTRLIGLDEALISNRLLWIAVAIGVLALASVRFRFATTELPHLERRALSPSTQHRSDGLRARRSRKPRQLLAIAMEAFRDLHKGRGWLLVPFTAALFIMTATEVLEVELGTPGAATTGRVAALFAADELTRFVALLIAISAGELVWRERDARMNAIADVTPVPEWLAVLGRFLALALMLVVTQIIFLVAGVIVQAMLGHQAFELGLYLKFLLGFHLAAYLLFAALAMVIHVLVNQKYVGNVVAVLAFIGVQMARELGVRHNLLLYGSAPEPVYSEMAGFGPQAGPWLWFTLYWSGWALLFGVVAYLFWMRGEERGLRWRFALARRRLTRWPVAVGAAAIAIIAGTGAFVFYNTNVLNHYYTEAEFEERRAEYERRFGRYASLAQPTLAATKLHVDFYPERNAATIRGSYRLENRSGVAIGAIHVLANTVVETKDVVFDRASRLTLRDDGFGYSIYVLDKALQPGKSIWMNFRIDYAPRGFTNDGWNPSVMGNGSWIQHRAEQSHSQRQWLPFVGYQTNPELDNASARKRHGLPARPEVPALDDVAARYKRQGNEKIKLETIIGTAANQTGVAPGALRRAWTANGRRYFHYVTDAPITKVYTIYSARYAVRRARWRDVAIEIFHHPTHTENLERMLRSVTATLDDHTRNYSPYPHKQVRLVEYPSSGRGLGLTSFPGLIEYSEAFALVRPDDDPRKIDFPFAIIAHEMGHQWWGHQLLPATVEGAPLLSESLAWYSAMLVVEKTLGRDHLIRLLDVMRSEFMAPHQTREVPLLKAFDRLDAYRTGPFAMYALREAIGEKPIDAALRKLLARFDPSRPPYPTSLDFYAELRAATPQHSLLKDLFEEITFWDLRTKKVEVQPAGRGTYRVTLHIDAQKLKADAAGKEKSVPMNDLIELAVFDARGRALYRHPHRVRSGEQTITAVVTSPHAPARAGVDPDHELLDRKPEDNIATAASGAP